MPRWLVSGVRFVEVLLLGAFAAVFAFEILNRRWQWPGGIVKTSGTTASVLPGFLLLIAVLTASPVAKADTPSPAILEELEKRLLAAPPCTPNCAEIVDASVVVGAGVPSHE